MDQKQNLLKAMFTAAIDAADPMRCVPSHLPKEVKGRLIVIGAGKASARMAQAVEAHWDGPLEGIVITRYGHAAPCDHIRIVEAAHPVPDQAGEKATQEILQLVEGLHEDDVVLALISGGGSALLTAPAGDITLAQKQAINRALLSSGAAIDEMNTVRKHLSRVKGGRLAETVYPARLLSLMISDVPGDDPGVIASGPTVGVETKAADVLALLERYEIDVPDEIRRHLAQSIPPPHPNALRHVENRVIAAPQSALSAASELARAQGVTPLILGDAIEGEAREVAKVISGIAKQVKRHGQPASPPAVLISGGETTVTMRGSGRGGRNVEFLLALAIALDGAEWIYAIAGDTDGVDGAEEIAGAVITPDTLSHARCLGIDPRACLENNDAHRFFEALDDQVITGPTLTNVNDFRAVLIG